MSVLAYDQVTVCIATKESDWEHLSICISLHVFIFGGGDEKWGMKDEKNNDRREGLRDEAPQKPENFDARKGNRNHIFDPAYGVIN